MGIRDLVADLRAKAEIDTVYFVGCGGSLGGFYPAYYLLRQESCHFRTELITSNEFVYAPPKSCGTNALVVLCTMRGTLETIRAQDTAHALGATTVGLYVDESDLSRRADYPIRYMSIADDSAPASKVNANLALKLAFELLKQYECYPHYDEAMTAFDQLDAVYAQALEIARPMARDFAADFADTRELYVMGAGASLGAAYIYSICNVQEMLCIHSATINHGEFFHGPFEITNDTADFFVLHTAGPTRPMDDRTLAFLARYARRYYVLDSGALGIDAFGENVREYFNQSLLSPVLNNAFMRALSAATGKDYHTRHYMWQVPY